MSDSLEAKLIHLQNTVETRRRNSESFSGENGIEVTVSWYPNQPVTKVLLTKNGYALEAVYDEVAGELIREQVVNRDQTVNEFNELRNAEEQILFADLQAEFRRLRESQLHRFDRPFRLMFGVDENARDVIHERGGDPED